MLAQNGARVKSVSSMTPTPLMAMWCTFAFNQAWPAGLFRGMLDGALQIHELLLFGRIVSLDFVRTKAGFAALNKISYHHLVQHHAEIKRATLLEADSNATTSVLAMSTSDPET